MSWYFFIASGFEPVTIAAALMLVVCLLSGNRRLMLPLAMLLAVMYGWRALYVVHSKRYFIILVVAMIVVIAAGGERLEALAKKHLPEYSKYFIRGLFCILTAICLLKLVRINPYQDFIIRAAASVKADAAKFSSPIVIDCSKHGGRAIEFYSGVKAVGGKYLPVISEAEAEAMADTASNYSRSHDAVYIAVLDNKAEAPNLERNGFVRIASFRRTRKPGRDLFSVYRYQQSGRSAVSDAPVIEHSDMEQCLPVPVSAPSPRRSNMLDDPAIRLPAGWVPNFGDGFAADAHAVLRPETAWSGQALRLSGKKLLTVFCPSRRYPASQEYRISFRYMARELSRIRVKAYCYDDAGKMRGQFTVSTVKAERMSAPVEFSCRLKKPGNVSSGHSVLAICLDYGDVLLDDLTIRGPCGGTSAAGSGPGI